jgi:replicative DNA helicase
MTTAGAVGSKWDLEADPAELLKMIDPNQLTRDEWRSVAAGFKNSGGADFVFLDWCSQYASDDQSEDKTLWRSCGKGSKSRGKCTRATLAYFAKMHSPAEYERYYEEITGHRYGEQPKRKQTAARTKSSTGGKAEKQVLISSKEHAYFPGLSGAAKELYETIDVSELERPIDYTEYLRDCRERLKRSPEAIAYIQARGISLETALACFVGYDPEWESPTAIRRGKKTYPSKRLILPTSKTHYVARALDDVGKFAKMNEGNPCLFNARALRDSSKEIIFVTEGYFDALSIIECGAAAIALNSTSNAQLLVEQLEKQRTKATLILCLDNDESGRKRTETLREDLQRLNINYICADICSGCKDPNEALQADRERFRQAISDAVDMIARPDSTASYIDSRMFADIEVFKQAGNRRTGFAELDRQAGGLFPGLYVLAAVTSLGKTSFALQLADQLAEAGEDVLFFSLEQSRLELVSKSIARKMAQKDASRAVNSLAIRRGFLSDNVLQAADEYKKSISNRLSIIEGNFKCTLTFIGDYVRQYVRRTGKRPAVFLDYLQILQPEQSENGRTQGTRETVDSAVTELKRLSRELSLTVIVISSVNRASYLLPFSYESLKESGGIEFTADCIWGLQLQVMNDPLFDKKENLKAKRQKVKDKKAESPRKIELVCLKNRYGVSSFSCFFDYYPEQDLFTEGVNEYEIEQDEPKKAGRRL